MSEVDNNNQNKIHFYLKNQLFYIKSIPGPYGRFWNNLSQRECDFQIDEPIPVESKKNAIIGWELFLCHPIEISISLERLYQSSPFFHHCTGKFMIYFEMNIIFSRFFLFLKYSPHPMIAFFLDSPGRLYSSATILELKRGLGGRIQLSFTHKRLC